MILVIGGTGKIGREVVQKLAQAKAKTRVLGRSAQKLDEARSLGLETALGDYLDIPSVEKALAGADHLFLLTVATPSQGSEDIAVMDAAKRSGVKHIVYLSAIGADIHSPLTLGQQHGKAEEHLKSMGLGYTILQPHSFMQNLLGQAGSIKAQGSLYGNFKDGKVAMVDARDIASVAVACLTQPGHEGKTYAITGGEALSYAQVAEKFSTYLVKKVAYVDVPSEGLVKSMTGMGFPEWLAGDLAKLGEVFAAGHGSTVSDVVEKVTHQKPITLDQFIQDNLPAFR
jgi:uncharacterized protein YbjT (DUF2867 family)